MENISCLTKRFIRYIGIFIMFDKFKTYSGYLFIIHAMLSFLSIINMHVILSVPRPSSVFGAKISPSNSPTGSLRFFTFF
jgi:hypothetical protein